MGEIESTLQPERLTYPAGYAVVRECLDLQADAAPRSSVARLFGVSPLHPDARSWFVGAVGEIRVGELLDRLGPEWTVLHAVPVGTRGSDIDHVIVGPGGVFTVNTKRHPGAKVWLGERMLMVAGQKTDHLRNSRHEATRASKLLTAATGQPVAVRAMLVLVGVGAMTVKQRPSDVTVVTDAQLVRWISKRPRVLADEQVEVIASAAARVRTWHKTEQVVVDETQGAEFEALRVEEGRAETVQMLWKAALFVGVLGTALSVAFGAL